MCIRDSYVEYPASKKDLLAVLRLHNAAQKLASALPSQKAVSYTHLDVYKRQGMPCL